MSKQVGKVWLPHTLLDQIRDEATRAFPNETGGVLIGYWAKPSTEAVITHIAGPGPAAVHKPHKFIPDPEYQEQRIAYYYEQSGRTHVYLGDWHTHPNASSYVSRDDRATLRQIATYPTARAPVPLMAVLGGGDPWVLRIWRFAPLRLFDFLIGFQLKELSYKIY